MTEAKLGSREYRHLGEAHKQTASPPAIRCRAMIAAVQEEHGRLDILVNNAGLLRLAGCLGLAVY